METIPVLSDKHVLLGVTGSIAAFKAADLASKLTQAGALVDVVMTEAAERFVTPLTFQSLTGRRAYRAADFWGGEAHVVHVGLAETADVLAVAPCTADTMARLAQGRANDLLAVAVLAARCPVLLAPAMDGGMWQDRATQANAATLVERGMKIIGPEVGRMASGLRGVGRMTPPLTLLGHIRRQLAANGPLAGRRLVVSAGGTEEPIDPVRFVANHSSGKQGFAIVQAALDAGADVTVVAGPVALETPVGATRVDVTTALEMRDAVLAASANADALVMAAAVADFRPETAVDHKIKRGETETMTLTLAMNPDILLEVAAAREQHGHPTVVVGFAAESQNVLRNAQVKLSKKQLDFIVANDVTAPDSGFGTDTNQVTIIDADGLLEPLPLMSKRDVAEVVIKKIVALLQRRA